MENRKAEKFKQLAEARVNRAIKDIRSIGKLSNRNNYCYEQEQVSKIVKALREEVASLEKAFANKDGSDFVFRL